MRRHDDHVAGRTAESRAASRAESAETAEQEGTLSSFQLTLRSGISGRPLKVITDHRGAGSGSVEFGDDPRMYEFLVDSSGVDWSVSVEETFAPRE